MSTSVEFERLLRVLENSFGVREADFQVRRAANDSKATCSGRTAAERRRSAKAESGALVTF